MDRAAALTKAKLYADLVTANYSADKIVLFGSYARGNYSENSDIDIAIVINSFSGDFLTVSTSLCKLTRTVDYRIEPVLVDINNDKSGFVHDILTYGIVVYDKDNTA